jgi:Copper transport outer membrane protein, MctB
MFDYRYHALSLAAVLLALAVGVLLGVAIGDSDLVSSAKSGIVHDLRSEVSAARSQADQLQDQLTSEQAVEQGLYPIAVHGLLSNRAIGLVFLGATSDQIDGLVREAVTQGGGDLAVVLAVREPLEAQALARQMVATPYAGLASDPRVTERLGVRLGKQLVNGGALFDQLQSRLLSSFDGRLGGLAGIVLVRAEPAPPSGEGAQAAARLSAAFEAGLVAGMSATGVPVVGVQTSGAEPSQIVWYKGRNISSVDDVDHLVGRAALAFALAGARGAFGEQPSATSGLLPKVVDSSTTSTVASSTTTTSSTSTAAPQGPSAVRSHR